jgi:hypothetical protein
MSVEHDFEEELLFGEDSSRTVKRRGPWWRWDVYVSRTVVLMNGSIAWIHVIVPTAGVAAALLLIVAILREWAPKSYYGTPWAEGSPLYDTLGVRNFTSFVCSFIFFFFLNCVQRYLDTLVTIWRWKYAYVVPQPVYKVAMVTSGIETFVTLTDYVSILLSFTHVSYLANVIVARSIVGSVVIGSTPFHGKT